MHQCDIDVRFILGLCKVDARRRIIDVNKCELMRYRYKAGASRGDIGANSLQINASRSDMMQCLRGAASKSMRTDANRCNVVERSMRVDAIRCETLRYLCEVSGILGESMRNECESARYDAATRCE